MAILVAMQLNNRRARGLTLIEVLVALAIIGIALTAIINASASNIRATAHVQKKTQARWIATLILNEVEVGLLSVPSDRVLAQTTHALNRNWYWQAQALVTPNPDIKKISIAVAENPGEAAPILMRMETYVYLPK